MDSILEKVDFEKYDVLNIILRVEESDMFDDSQKDEVDEYGQSLDMISNLRRAIKHSHPFDNKKLIKTINPHEAKENEEGEECRDIDLEYYLLVEKEEMESFDLEELHDVLQDEWNGGNANCEIIITRYNKEND